MGKEPWFGRLPNAKDLTVRTLLNHSSGLPEYFEGKAFPDSLLKDPESPRKPEDLLAFVFDRKPLFAVGKGWAYSDTDYVVVGMIVERTFRETRTEKNFQKGATSFRAGEADVGALSKAVELALFYDAKLDVAAS